MCAHYEIELGFVRESECPSVWCTYVFVDVFAYDCLRVSVYPPRHGSKMG